MVGEMREDSNSHKKGEEQTSVFVQSQVGVAYLIVGGTMKSLLTLCANYPRQSAS